MSNRDPDLSSRLEFEAGRFTSAKEVRAFFDQIDRRADSIAPEPDWEAHRRVLFASRTRGLPDPT